MLKLSRKYKIGYMCATDWHHEVECAEDGVHIYPSIRSLKHYRKCTKECGIVRVKMTASKKQEGLSFRVGVPKKNILTCLRSSRWKTFMHNVSYRYGHK